MVGSFLFKLYGIEICIVKLYGEGNRLSFERGDRSIILKADSLVSRVSEDLYRAIAFVAALKSEICAASCRGGDVGEKLVAVVDKFLTYKLTLLAAGVYRYEAVKTGGVFNKLVVALLTGTEALAKDKHIFVVGARYRRGDLYQRGDGGAVAVNEGFGIFGRGRQDSLVVFFKMMTVATAHKKSVGYGKTESRHGFHSFKTLFFSAKLVVVFSPFLALNVAQREADEEVGGSRIGPHCPPLPLSTDL